MILLIFYISLALGVSFLCSIMEAVLLSITPSFIAKMEKKNGRTGRKLRKFKDNIDNPLAAILSLNTIAHTVGAAGAGAQAAIVFGSNYVGVISAVLTFLILVISEIIPKTLGAVHWRSLAPIVARIMTPTILFMWPLVKLSESITKIITHGKKKLLIHRDEFIALTELSDKEGVFYKEESRILKNLFRLRQVLTRDIMTPRTVVHAFDETMSVQESLVADPNFHFSRIPVYGKEKHDITGFVLKSDILMSAVKNKNNIPLTNLKRSIHVVIESLPLRNLFEQFMDQHAHIALVVDEYGITVGIVTMEDLIETILGLEIVDEADNVHDMRELARRQWFKRAKGLGIIPQDTDLETWRMDEIPSREQ